MSNPTVKLTAVSLNCNGRQVQLFTQLAYNEQGKPVLPDSLLTWLQKQVGCNDRGQTFTVG